MHQQLDLYSAHQCHSSESKLTPEKAEVHSAYLCLLKSAENTCSWLAIPLQPHSSIPSLFHFISSVVPMLEVSFSCKVLESWFLDPLSHWVISYHSKMTAHGPTNSTSHIACSQPEVITKHACMRSQHSHLSHVWCECQRQRARTVNLKDPCAWEWVTSLTFFGFQV